MPGIKEGLATVVTKLKESGAVQKIVKGLPTGTLPVTGKTEVLQGKNVQGFPNVLETFASYSPLWTLACLTQSQFNDPRSYRNSPADLKHIIFSSAGRYDAQRVKTKFGTPEYYLQNFLMNTIVTATKKTGNSNAIGFEFDIYEPYSMGLFLQSLQIAALDAGHKSYLEAPYVLKLDILGYTDDGKLYQGIKPKYFTIKFIKVAFDTNESGSNYKCEAIPFNHQGFGDVLNRSYQDIAITSEKGKNCTVVHLLSESNEGLCAVLNRAEEDLVLDGKKLIADEYVIQFPNDPADLILGAAPPTQSGATANPNTSAPRSVGSTSQTNTNFGSNVIALSDMNLKAEDGGNFNFKKEDQVIDANTGKVYKSKMNVDPNTRKFQFPQNEPITGIITRIIQASSYAFKAIQSKPDASGMIDWFKIDVQLKILGWDNLTGKNAKQIIYRVYPYKVHSSVFANPTSAPPGYSDLEKKIAKRYNYIYTGQNNDVLKFDIKIDNQFYTAANPKPESKSGANANVAQKGSQEKPGKKTETPKGPAGDAALASNTGGGKTGPDPKLAKVAASPSGNETTEELVAKAFNNALMDNVTDLVSINLEILGDPYWLVDSGIGNYFAAKGTNPLTTADGTMNYEGSDVYVYLSFRTPTDVNEANGLYYFPDNNKESQFSGIYKVITVKNVFADGYFKQELECLRMPRQALDFDGKSVPVDPENTTATKVKEEEKPKTNTYDTDSEFYG